MNDHTLLDSLIAGGVIGREALREVGAGQASQAIGAAAATVSDAPRLTLVRPDEDDDLFALGSATATREDTTPKSGKPDPWPWLELKATPAAESAIETVGEISSHPDAIENNESLAETLKSL